MLANGQNKGDLSQQAIDAVAPVGLPSLDAIDLK
jgi:hypothetical protein